MNPKNDMPAKNDDELALLTVVPILFPSESFL